MKSNSFRMFGFCSVIFILMTGHTATASLTFGAKNTALLGVPVEPQEVYLITNRDSFAAPTSMLTFVVSDNAAVDGPEYTAPNQIKALYLQRNPNFTCQIVKASQWNGQRPAIVISIATNLSGYINSDSDWIDTYTKLGALYTADGYRMLIESNLVVIAGKDLRGAFYGAQTFLTMLNTTPNSTIPSKAIRDWPDLPFRAALLSQTTIPESQYGQLAYYHYNSFILDGAMWFNLTDPTNLQTVQTWKTLCAMYYLDPIPDIALMGHANNILKIQPAAAEGFTAIEQPMLLNMEWYTLQCPNVIDQSNCLLTVKSLDGTTTYARDTDYEVSAGVLSYPYAATNTPWKIRRTSGSSIPSGEQVRVTYAYVAPDSESYCPSEPLATDIAKQAILNALNVVQPKYLHIAHDEIRVVGQCPRCRSTGSSNAKLVADEITMLKNYISSQSPSCKVMIWADTMDIQQHEAGLDTPRLINLLPSGLILCHWRYENGELDWMDANMLHSTSRGFLSVGTTWNLEQNANEWAQKLRKTVGGVSNWGNLSHGIILGAWGGDWSQMATVGKRAWSVRESWPPMPNQKIRTITQLSIDPPPAGSSFHLPFAQNFDSLDKWALPVPWQWCYTPNATTQLRYFGSSGKGFEVSGDRMVGRGARMYLDNTLGYGYLHFSQQMWIDSATGGTGFLRRSVEIHGPRFVQRVVFRVIKSGNVHVVQHDTPSGTVTIPGYTFPTDQWVRLDIMVNIDQCTWSAWVNDVLLLEDAPFFAPSKDIAGVQWMATTDGTVYNGYWIDNVVVEHYDSPQVFLKFDNSSIDSGTAGISGVTLGAHDSYASNSAAAYLNQNVLFSPGSDTDSAVGVTIPHNDALNLDSFTVTGWLRPDSNGMTGCGMGFYDKYQSVGSEGIRITYSWDPTNHLRFYFDVNDKGVYTSSSNEIVTAGGNAPWVFTALTYNANTRTAKAYFGYADTPVYATSDVTFSGSGPLHPIANTLDAIIGFRRSTGSRAMDGNLDDFRIYKRILTPADLEFIRRCKW